MLTKLLLFPVLMLCSCILAAFYGAIHNQISYGVAPGYFHEFKFIQFNIDAHLQNRIGAALVGIGASWWMGFIIGLPIYLVGLLIKGARPFIAAFLQSATVVVLTTIAIGLAALLFANLFISPNNLPVWMDNRQVSDPASFAKAGVMHNYSYLGGVVGLVFGLLVIARQAWRSRKQPEPPPHN